MTFVCPDSSVMRVVAGDSGMPVKAMRTAAPFTGRSPKEEVTQIFKLPKEGSLAADRPKID